MPTWRRPRRRRRCPANPTAGAPTPANPLASANLEPFRYASLLTNTPLLPSSSCMGLCLEGGRFRGREGRIEVQASSQPGPAAAGGAAPPCQARPPHLQGSSGGSSGGPWSLALLMAGSGLAL